MSGAPCPLLRATPSAADTAERSTETIVNRFLHNLTYTTSESAKRLLQWHGCASRSDGRAAEKAVLTGDRLGSHAEAAVECTARCLAVTAEWGTGSGSERNGRLASDAGSVIAERRSRCTVATRQRRYAGAATLLMELVVNGKGDVAPRLNDVDLTEAGALELHALLLNQVVRMLCTGVIHGDLWEYNILLAADGQVIIDLRQAVDAAGNNEAASMLKRDFENLAAYLWQFAPQILSRALDSAL